MTAERQLAYEREAAARRAEYARQEAKGAPYGFAIFAAGGLVLYFVYPLILAAPTILQFVVLLAGVGWFFAAMSLGESIAQRRNAALERVIWPGGRAEWERANRPDHERAD